MNQVPDGLMYAQVEQAYAFQDYRPSKPCVRLVGIDEDSFRTEAFNLGGCRTFFIDIPWSTVLRILGLPEARAQSLLGTGSPGVLLENWPDGLWIRLTYSLNPGGDTYAYEIFADAEPVHVSLTSFAFAPGPGVAAPPLPTKLPAVAWDPAFSLFAYHVGQGMCALMAGSAEGVLFDVGAGTPVTRAAYRAGGPGFTNDLDKKTLSLKLQAVISHPDSDHWRLLDWDSALCGRVSAIYLPAGTPALAFSSTHVKPSTFGIGNTAVTNGPGGSLLFKIHRSQPSRSDRNGECLVVETHCGGLSLFPGDYVYSRMASDSNPDIVALSSSTLDAVMVPHHGDAASASVSVVPALPLSTYAFFSAGTHSGYKHPTTASLGAHATAKFDNIDHHTWSDIREQSIP